MLTKEQNEIIEFTGKEFAQHDVEDQAKMYAAVCYLACMKWPEHARSFVDTYKEMWLNNNNKKEADNGTPPTPTVLPGG